MADPRFYSASGPFSLRILADIGGAILSDDADSEKLIRDVAPLETADSHDLSFLDNAKYLKQFEKSRAGACIVRQRHAEHAATGMTLLFADDPYKSYALVAQAFYPNPRPMGGISPNAHIDVSADVGSDCDIGAGAVIGASAVIGTQCRIGPNAVVGPGVEIGEETSIGAGSSLSHCLIGHRVTVHPGVRIGQDGFGFALDPAGYVKVPQLGRVVISDDVEIGANTTIDRGSGPDTIIGAGCWIDNLVQIGHNVTLGEGCIIVAQVGISGSTKLDARVMVGGQSGFTGHLTIGAGARIAAKCGVMHDVQPGATVGGIPAQPIRDFHRQTVMLGRMVGEKGNQPDD